MRLRERPHRLLSRRRASVPAMDEPLSPATAAQYVLEHWGLRITPGTLRRWVKTGASERLSEAELRRAFTPTSATGDIH